MLSGVLLSLCRNLHYSKHWCPVNTHSLKLKWQLMVICQQLFTSVILLQHTGFGVLVFFCNWLHHQFCGWHFCLADGCSPLSLIFLFLSLSLVSPVVSAHQTWGRVSSCVPALLWWSSPFWQIPGETGSLRQRESVTGAEWQTVQFWHSEHNSTHKPKPRILMRPFISLGFSLLRVSQYVGVSKWREIRAQNVKVGALPEM